MRRDIDLNKNISADKKLTMTRQIIALLILTLFASCGQDEKTNVPLNNHLDKEIGDRITRIQDSPENKITRTMATYVNASLIDGEVKKLIELVNSSPLDDSLANRVNRFFKNYKDNFYSEIESYEFIDLSSDEPKEKAIVSIKLNELTLLDRIIFTRKNKIGKTSYQAAFMPTTQTDTTYSGDIILLKTDTLFAQSVLINLSDTFKDTIYVPIAYGKGKLEVLKEKRPYDFKVCGFVKSGGQFFPYKFTEKIK
jgi:hypothetical protein